MSELTRTTDTTHKTAGTDPCSESLLDCARSELSESVKKSKGRGLSAPNRLIAGTNDLGVPSKAATISQSTLPNLELYDSTVSRSAPARTNDMDVQVPPSSTGDSAPAGSQAIDSPAKTPKSEMSARPGSADDGLDFVASWISGIVGRGAGMKLATMAASGFEKNPNPVVKGVAYVSAAVLASIAARESLDVASHGLLHTERHSFSEIVTQGTAGASGALVGKHLPEVLGSRKERLLGSALSNGLDWSVINLGMQNPFVINKQTGKNYTVRETASEATSQFAEGALLGAAMHYPGKAASATWRGAKSAYRKIASHF